MSQPQGRMRPSTQPELIGPLPKFHELRDNLRSEQALCSDTYVVDHGRDNKGPSGASPEPFALAREPTSERVVLLSEALAIGRSGRYQIQAAIAARHAEAHRPEATDWHGIPPAPRHARQAWSPPGVGGSAVVALSEAEGRRRGGLDVISG